MISGLSNEDVINESEFKNLTNLENVFHVFDIRNVGLKWNLINKRLSNNCALDMEKYLKGLQKRNSWAIKMDDSTGKYNHGFFWGNNYWTGSRTQCSFIHRKESSNKHVIKIIKNTDLTYINGNYLEASDELHQNPPFIPGFYMLKILLNHTRILGPPRTVLMGLCLPGSCQLNDIVEMTRNINSADNNFQILGVRSPTLNDFSLWKDLTFQILFVSTVIVTILLIGGTGYDIILRSRSKKPNNMKYSKDLTLDASSGFGCTTYDLSQVIPIKNNKPNCEVYGIPNGVNNNNSDENLAIEPVISTEIKLSTKPQLYQNYKKSDTFIHSVHLWVTWRECGAPP